MFKTLDVSYDVTKAGSFRSSRNMKTAERFLIKWKKPATTKNALFYNLCMLYLAWLQHVSALLSLQLPGTDTKISSKQTATKQFTINLHIL
jgi:hypothetical protein